MAHKPPRGVRRCAHLTQRQFARTCMWCCGTASTSSCSVGSTLACTRFLRNIPGLKLLRNRSWVNAVANCDKHVCVAQLLHVCRAPSERLEPIQLKVPVYQRNTSACIP